MSYMIQHGNTVIIDDPESDRRCDMKYDHCKNVLISCVNIEKYL